MGFIGMLVAMFARSSAIGVIRFLALRALLLFLVTMILPAVLVSVWFYCRTFVLDTIISFFSVNLTLIFNDANSAMVQLTGLSAYLAQELRLAEGVGVLISCAILAWGLRTIRG